MTFPSTGPPCDTCGKPSLILYCDGSARCADHPMPRLVAARLRAS